MMNGPVRTIVSVVFVLLMIAAAFSLAPIQDETYYWTWSRIPAWSYVDHPPATAWILAASDLVFGSGLAALRIPTLLAISITAFASYGAAERLNASGSLALLLLCGAPMFAVGYLPATPDPFQGAAAALAAYALVRAYQGERRFAFFAAFLLVASILIKHTSALLLAGAFLGACSTREGRALLKRKETWLGIFAGFLVLAPWLYTELSSQGSLAFQSARTFQRGNTRGLVAIPVLLGGLMIALGPVTAALLLWRGSRAVSPIERVLYGGALVLIAACVLPVWLGGGELNWTMPALVFAAPALAASLEGRAKQVARAAAYVCAAIVALCLVHVVHPFFPLPANKDTTRRGEVFVSVAARAGALAERHHAKMIVTRRYQTASTIRYHLNDVIPVLELGTTRRSQYDVWPRPRPQPGDTVIIVLNEELPADYLALESETVDRFTLTVAKVSGGAVARSTP
jgi:hypothetical protein